MATQLQQSWELLREKLWSALDGMILMLPNLLISLMVGFIGFYLIQLLRKRIRSLFLRGLRDQTMASIMSRIISFLLMAGVLFLILGILQLDQLLTSLLATAGVLGLAVGLALQDPLANAFGGILLSVRDRYNLGDLVETNGHMGWIREVNLKSTVMETPAGQMVSVPNTLVLQNPIINYSHLGRRRVTIQCGISYGEELHAVEHVVRNALEELSSDNQCTLQFFWTGFGASSIDFEVWLWIDQVDDLHYHALRSTVIERIKEAFDKADITIPFPIRTLDFGIKGGTSMRAMLPNGADHA